MPSNDKPLPLTVPQLTAIQAKGSAAVAQMNVNQDAVGLFVDFYRYIADQMTQGQIPGSSADQSYWFREAILINADDEASPAGFFVRDVTRLGMGATSNSDPRIQRASNTIGKNVF